MTPFWISVRCPDLAQGDFLRDCMVPAFAPDFGRAGEPDVVPVTSFDLIVITQTCDLVNGKAAMVALCPIWTLEEFESYIDPAFRSKGRWEEVRKGRIEGLHMLASPDAPANNREALVVDFRQIYSLPYDYLRTLADGAGNRWRLQSPFLERFSQAFARFFMRVGVPSEIPRFK